MAFSWIYGEFVRYTPRWVTLNQTKFNQTMKTQPNPINRTFSYRTHTHANTHKHIHVEKYTRSHCCAGMQTNQRTSILSFIRHLLFFDFRWCSHSAAIFRTSFFFIHNKLQWADVALYDVRKCICIFQNLPNFPFQIILQ